MYLNNSPLYDKKKSEYFFLLSVLLYWTIIVLSLVPQLICYSNLVLAVWGGGYLIFVIPTDFKYLKKNPKSKNHQLWVFENLQNQQEVPCLGIWKNSDSKNNQFWVFQKVQSTVGQLHKRTSKDPAVFKAIIWLPWLFSRTKNCMVICNNQVSDFVIITVI
jgi:hypothetical protein